MPWSRGYYLILVVLPNRNLPGRLPQSRTDLRLIMLTITISNVYIGPLKVL